MKIKIVDLFLLTVISFGVYVLSIAVQKYCIEPSFMQWQGWVTFIFCSLLAIVIFVAILLLAAVVTYVALTPGEGIYK